MRRTLTRVVLSAFILTLLINYNAMAGWSVIGSGTDNPLYSVWGSSPTDVFAVGPYDIIHYDGSNWTFMDTVGETGVLDIWGSSENEIFAVGNDSILYYNGEIWSTMVNRIGVTLRGI